MSQANAPKVPGWSRLIRALLMAAAAAACPSTWATTTCTATIDSFNFGAISLTAHSTLTGTVTVTCTTTVFLSTSLAKIRYCVNIGEGTGGAASLLSPRRLRNAANDILNLDLAQDATFSSPLGSSNIGMTVPITGTMQHATIVYLPVSTTATHVIHARIPAQPGAAVGNYQSSFAGTQAELSFRYEDEGSTTMPSSCTTGGTGNPARVSTPFTVSASISPECNLSTADILDFGQFPGLPGPEVTASAAINMTCRLGTPWRMSLGNGLHAQGATRRMSNGSGAFARYELYRDAAMTLPFGQTVNVDQQAGTGTGSNQSVTVYGRVPAAQSLTPGNYSDQVVVTVTY